MFNQHKVLVFGCSIFLARLAVPTVALADEQTPPANLATPNSVAASTSVLGEVIVTAQRRTERLMDVPVAISTYDAQQLEAAGVNNSRDLPLLTPGLRLDAAALNIEPAIRGVTSTASNSAAEPNVATYVDGVYQPTQIAAFFALPDVENIEILKGPQGSLYGRNATGGAILINTKSPSFMPSGEIGGSVGKFTERGSSAEGHAYVTGPIIRDVLAGSFTINRRALQGYVRNLITGENTGDDRTTSVRGKLLFTPADWARIEASIFYVRMHDETDELMTILNGNSILRGVPGVIIPTRPWTEASDTHGGLDANYYMYSLKAVVDAAIGTFTSTTGQVDLKAPNTLDGDYTNIPAAAYDSRQYSSSFTQELTFVSKPIGPVKFTAGAIYYNRSTGSKPLIINFPIIDFSLNIFDKGQASSLAEFLEVSYDATDRLHFTLGGRHTEDKVAGYASTTEPSILLGRLESSKFTPRAAVMYKVADGLNIYYNYAEGFKSGMFNAVAFQTTPVLPETVKSNEVGLKYESPSRTFTGNLAAFHYDYKDLQVTSIINGVSVFQNAASAKISGAELETNTRLTDAFSIVLGGAYLHARYDQFPNAAVNVALPTGGSVGGVADLSGATMLRAPEFTFTTVGNYEHEYNRGKLNLSLSGYYSTKVRLALESRITQGSYFTSNVRAAWTPAGTSLTAALFARNLTNEKYIISSLIATQGDGVIYAPPREIGVELLYKF